MRLRSSIFTLLLRQCHRALLLPPTEIRVPAVFDSETYQAPPERVSATHIVVSRDAYCVHEYSPDMREPPMTQWGENDLEAFLRRYMRATIEHAARLTAVVTSEVPIATLITEGRFGEYLERQAQLEERMTSRFENHLRSRTHRALATALRLAR